MCGVSVIFSVASSLTVFSFKIFYIQFFKANPIFNTQFPLGHLYKPPGTKPCCNEAILLLFWQKKTNQLIIISGYALPPKTPILSKRQTAHARLQRSYLYLEAGHCYCPAPYKAHTTCWKQANAINNTGAIRRWNAERGRIQPDLEDALHAEYVRSRRQPARMPAHETQTHAKDSGDISKAYTSQPLCLYQHPTHLPASTLQSLTLFICQ